MTVGDEEELGPGSVYEWVCAVLLADPDRLLADVATGTEALRRRVFYVAIVNRLHAVLNRPVDPPTTTMPALPAVPPTPYPRTSPGEPHA